MTLALLWRDQRLNNNTRESSGFSQTWAGPFRAIMKRPAPQLNPVNLTIGRHPQTAYFGSSASYASMMAATSG